MAWQGLVGHDVVVERFRRALARGRLASSFLFVGPAGVGKRSLALGLAQTLLCETRPPELLAPCGTCPACLQVLAGTHPDLLQVRKPADKANIPVELFIGDKEHRMQEGLCHDLSLRPSRGKRRIAIVDDADALNVEGANCLLKTLEEPPPRSVLILIGTSPTKQLPTIRSRCQIVRFRPLTPQVVAQQLVAEGAVEGPEQARRLAEVAEGSLERARELNDSAFWEFRGDFLQRLAQRPGDFTALAKSVSAFVDEAGKDAAPRRQRLRLVIGLAVEFYRALLAVLTAAPSGDHDVARQAAAAARSWVGGIEAAGACLEACLDANQAVDRNVNQATLLESWLDRLAAGGTSGV